MKVYKDNSLKICLMIVLVIILITSIYYIISNLKQEKKQNEEFKEIQEIVQEEKNEEIKEDYEINNIELLELYKKNNDLIGWIKINNSNIDYPVMKNGDFYLKRNFYKEYSSFGTPFIAEYCDENSDNIIIYGHHIKSGMMFADLDKYKSFNYYDNHKNIEFYYLEEDKTIKKEYEIIYCFKTTAESDGFKYYGYYNAENESEYNKFVNSCNLLSLYNTNVKTEYGDKFITLSTCEYSQKNGRMVVVGKLKS